jgi:1-acyl-sn-glycerol-3-phosphate acyltransferase
MLDAACWLNYEIGRWTTALALTLGWSLRVTGRHNYPKSGPVLIVSNHQCFFDPPAAGVAYERHIVFLARKTLFDNPGFGPMIRTLNALPVDQDGMAKDGLRAILDKLEAGHPVLVFPEGARTDDGGLAKMQPGITLLIKRIRCPIVPVGIAGAFSAWPRGRILPLPSPLFLPATNRTIGVAVGPPRDAATVADLPRTEMLDVIAADLTAQMVEAEKVRRKPRIIHKVAPAK